MPALALLEDIIPLCPKCNTYPYSAQEQRNVKEDFDLGLGRPDMPESQTTPFTPTCLIKTLTHTPAGLMHRPYLTCLINRH